MSPNGDTRPVQLNIELGAFGPSTILAQNYSMTMYAVKLEVGGAYWYHNSSYCIGFASTANITLDTCDIDSTDCADRLSWYLDNSKGGYRAGCETLLDFNSSWRKVIYKGNSLISCTQGQIWATVILCSQCSVYFGVELENIK